MKPYTTSENLSFSTQLNRPLGIAIDTRPDSFTIYILNNGNNTIQVIQDKTNSFKVYNLKAGGAPGAIAFDPSTNSVMIGSGPTNAPSEIDEYSGATSATPLQFKGVFLQDKTNTGPTGIVYPGLVGSDILISYLYSGNAVEYFNRTPPVPPVVISKGTGGCEGAAVNGNKIYVSNSTLNTITVYTLPSNGSGGYEAALFNTIK